jgi:hypothetical protein
MRPSILLSWHSSGSLAALSGRTAAHVRGIPVLPEPWPMKCEKDSTEVYPGQDPATANYYLGQHAVYQAIDKALMRPEAVRP